MISGVEYLEYQKDTVKLVVEEVEGDLVISYSDMGLEDTAFLITFLLDKVALFTGQEYNEVVDDFKEI